MTLPGVYQDIQSKNRILSSVPTCLVVISTVQFDVT